jgi:class 3 adenylate cyclase
MAEERLQRRLAAILSADVVGYSRLMDLDEAGTLSRLNALRRGLIEPAIAAHAGRIVKLMGDGVLVEFASAVAQSHAPSKSRGNFGIVKRMAPTLIPFGFGSALT